MLSHTSWSMKALYAPSPNLFQLASVFQMRHDLLMLFKLYTGFVIVLVQFSGLEALVIRFDHVPPARTRFSTAVFRYKLEDSSGRNPCLHGACSMFCELDGNQLTPCPIGVIKLRNLTVNQHHIFQLNVTTSLGERSSSFYQWFIDTVRPTATLSSERSFTNAARAALDITFTEPCDSGGGFKCLNASSCDIALNGPALVDTSSLQVIEPGLKYRVDIVFSLSSLYGHVIARMSDKFCSDQAGNPFHRTNSSITILHFDRREVHLDFWTSVPSYELEISQVLRTVLATNNMEEVKVFLDFSDSLLNSTEDVLAALDASIGNLVPIPSGSSAKRRFGFKVEKLTGTQIVTVRLQSSLLVGRSGSHVTPVKPIVFLYDATKPGVRLSTGTPGVTKEQNIHVVVEFTKPVFGFDSSGIAIRGGSIERFKELSKALYSLTITTASEKEVSIMIPDGKATDIAGNLNLASNQLRVKQYLTPPISVALYSFMTVPLLATSVTEALFALAATNLATVGDLSSWSTDILFSDPSRNLIGIVGHLQVFVFSDWLSMNLPGVYSETTKGLKWVIPRAKLPWKKVGSLLWPHHFSMYDRGLPYKDSSDMRLDSLWERKIVSPGNSIDMPKLPRHCPNWTASMEKSITSHTSPCKPWDAGLQTKQNLSMMDIFYGLPLDTSEYFVYFLKGEPLSAANVVTKMDHYTGWEDFKMNMFWLGVFSGALLAGHLALIFYLRWRTKKSVQGPLCVPRFELFLLALILPCVCQSAAFLFRGGTIGGIIVGSLVLAVPAAFILSVSLFLAVAICRGSFVQYKEIEHTDSSISWLSWLSLLITGQPTKGKWVQKEGLGSSFLSRFGLLFENRKGPAILVRPDKDDPSCPSKWTESGLSGIGRMRAVSSDDGHGKVTIPTGRKLLGCARTAYILLDLGRRAALGFIAGAYSELEKYNGQNQLIIAFSLTMVQLLYLISLKPYIRRGVQVVESISLLCEAGLFGVSFYLDHWKPYNKERSIGVVMLALLFTSFACQLVNEWFALIKCLLQLPPTQKPSLRLGLKWVLKGLILPLLPKKHWARLFPGSNKPTTGLVPVVTLSFESETDRNMGAGAMTATVVPVYSPESLGLVDANFRTLGTPENRTEGPAVGPSSQSGRLSYSAGKFKMAEENRPKGLKLESRGEMKKLQKMAMASFSGGRKHGEGSST